MTRLAVTSPATLRSMRSRRHEPFLVMTIRESVGWRLASEVPIAGILAGAADDRLVVGLSSAGDHAPGFLVVGAVPNRGEALGEAVAEIVDRVVRRAARRDGPVDVDDHLL